MVGGKRGFVCIEMLGWRLLQIIMVLILSVRTRKLISKLWSFFNLLIMLNVMVPWKLWIIFIVYYKLFLILYNFVSLILFYVLIFSQIIISSFWEFIKCYLLYIFYLTFWNNCIYLCYFKKMYSSLNSTNSQFNPHLFSSALINWNSITIYKRFIK